MRAFERLAGAFARAHAADAGDAKSVSAPSTSSPTQTISFRVTAQEKARLTKDAAGLSRSDYIRDCLFGTNVKPRKTRGKHPVKDHEALARVLGQLGRSEILKMLDQLSWAERDGIAHLDPSSAAALCQACANIAAMRDDLVQALGLKSVRAP